MTKPVSWWKAIWGYFSKPYVPTIFAASRKKVRNGPYINTFQTILRNSNFFEFFLSIFMHYWKPLIYRCISTKLLQIVCLINFDMSECQIWLQIMVGSLIWFTIPEISLNTRYCYNTPFYAMTLNRNFKSQNQFVLKLNIFYSKN